MAPKYTPPQNNNFSRGKIVVKPKDMKGTLSRLFRLTKGHRQGMTAVLFLAALASLSAIIAPYVSGLAITAVKNAEPVDFILIMLAVLYFADWLVRYLQSYIMAAVSQNMVHHIRQELFAKMRRLPLSFFDRHRHGELMSRLTNDIDNISTTVSSSLAMLLTYGFTIIGIFVMMIILSPLLTAVSLISVALIFILTSFVTKHTRKMFKERAECLGALNAQVEESVSGLGVIRVFSQEEQFAADFEEKNQKLCKSATQALIWSGILMPLANVINNLGYLIIAVASGIMFVEDYIFEIGLISSFLLYVRQFNRPFLDIANIYNNFQTAVAGAERIFEIMDEAEEPADPEGALRLTAPKGEIVLENVSFGYTEDRRVLNNINLEIPAGTKVAIVGPTGSGKTTIINLLTRFYDVNSGRILLDGHDLREYGMSELRNAYGVVLQDTSLFEVSVFENIAYGQAKLITEDEAKLREMVKEVCKEVGAHGFISRLPEGYDTVLTNGGTELSQGERQLLTIARVLLTNAPIMILDEATSSVDTVTEQKIKNAILKTCEGRTSFIIAHRLSTILDSDIIILIEDGEIIEKGTHGELLSLNGKYAAMYRTQTGEA